MSTAGGSDVISSLWVRPRIVEAQPLRLKGKNTAAMSATTTARLDQSDIGRVAFIGHLLGDAFEDRSPE
jgi:hypothetical protein